MTGNDTFLTDIADNTAHGKTSKLAILLSQGKSEFFNDGVS